MRLLLGVAVAMSVALSSRAIAANNETCPLTVTGVTAYDNAPRITVYNNNADWGVKRLDFHVTWYDQGYPARYHEDEYLLDNDAYVPSKKSFTFTGPQITYSTIDWSTLKVYVRCRLAGYDD